MKAAETPTLAGLAEIVERIHEQWDGGNVPRPMCDALADALGVGAACTGNPDTVRESRQYAPKQGLTFGFYSVTPGYRGDSDLVIVRYVADWRGQQYRGEVIGRGVRHDGGASFLSWFDATRYAAVLPDGCRKLITATVAAAATADVVTVAGLEAEKSASVRAGAIYSATYEALRALRDAADIETGRRS